MAEEKVARLQATVYLLKAARAADAVELFKSLAVDGAGAPLVTKLADDAGEGEFYALPADAQDPPWLDQLSKLLAAPPPALEAQFPSAVIAVKRSGRTFLLTFGQAHARVKDEWLEPDFGKITAQAVLAKVKSGRCAPNRPSASSTRQMKSHPVAAGSTTSLSSRIGTWLVLWWVPQKLSTAPSLENE